MSVFVPWSNIISVMLNLFDFTEGLPSFASIDVSFISLNLILPALAKILVDGGQVVALVKPQFEAGREQIGKNGIVRESSVHEKVLETVTAFALDYGFQLRDWTFHLSKVVMVTLSFSHIWRRQILLKMMLKPLLRKL